MNLIILAGAPFVAYYAFQKWRGKRGLDEVRRRVGLQLGAPRYIGYCAIASAVGVAALCAFPPPLAPFLREGSPQRAFQGLGIGFISITMALSYGMIKTGFAEEFLFRGLIAGSLSRRLPLHWANIAQATIFLLPHFLALIVMPEMWVILPLVFAGALFTGWVRIKSGSILGPWLLHGSLNVTMCLSVAARTAV